MRRIYIALSAIVTLACVSSTAGGEALRVAVDEYEFVRLKQPAATVLLANPNIADLAVENTRLLILVGRVPGETMLVVLDKQGGEILKTSVVVVPKLERAVTLQRGLAEATFSCDPRCSPVPNPGAGVAPPIAAGGGGAAEKEPAGAPASSAAEIAAAAAAAAAAATAAQREESE